MLSTLIARPPRLSPCKISVSIHRSTSLISFLFQEYKEWFVRCITISSCILFVIPLWLVPSFFLIASSFFLLFCTCLCTAREDNQDCLFFVLISRYCGCINSVWQCAFCCRVFCSEHKALSATGLLPGRLPRKSRRGKWSQVKKERNERSGETIKADQKHCQSWKMWERIPNLRSVELQERLPTVYCLKRGALV